MADLFNLARIDGIYDGTESFATSEVTVTLSSVTLEKTAEPMVWTGGNLTYTIIARNIEDQATGLAFEDGTITDMIDPALATLVANSVRIDGTPAAETTQYTFNPATGLLTVFLDDIAAGGSTTITFQVRKVAQ